METIVAIAHEYWGMFLFFAVVGALFAVSSLALWFTAGPIVGYGECTYTSAMKGEFRTFPKAVTIVATVAFVVSVAFLAVAFVSA